MTISNRSVASCTTSSVYVNLSKNSYRSASRGVPDGRVSFSGCKGTAFFRTAKTFRDFFFRKSEKNAVVDLCQAGGAAGRAYIHYLYIRTRMHAAGTAFHGNRQCKGAAYAGETPALPGVRFQSEPFGLPVRAVRTVSPNGSD